MKKLTDIELFNDYPGTGVMPADATDADVAKAELVLRALTDAGIRSPFDFNKDEARKLWGVTLGRYDTDVLVEAVEDFVQSEAREWPTLGQVKAAADFILTERAAEAAVDEARVTGPCDECDGNLWVRVEDNRDTVIPGKPGATHVYRGHHMRPCSRCPGMKMAYELYARGHFEAAHIEAGACNQCRNYHEPWRKRKNREAQNA